jgi:hypothetical protein
MVPFKVRVFFLRFIGDTEGTCQNFQSRRQVFLPQFEPDLSQIPDSSDNRTSLLVLLCTITVN